MRVSWALEFFAKNLEAQIAGLNDEVVALLHSLATLASPDTEQEERT